MSELPFSEQNVLRVTTVFTTAFTIAFTSLVSGPDPPHTPTQIHTHAGDREMARHVQTVRSES